MTNKEQEIGLQTTGMSLDLKVVVFLEDDKTAVKLVDRYGSHVFDPLVFEGEDPTHVVLGFSKHLAQLFGGCAFINTEFITPWAMLSRDSEHFIWEGDWFFLGISNFLQDITNHVLAQDSVGISCYMARPRSKVPENDLDFRYLWAPDDPYVWEPVNLEDGDGWKDELFDLLSRYPSNRVKLRLELNYGQLLLHENSFY